MDGFWCILTRRYGGECEDPSHDVLADAVRELFHEDLPEMTDRDFEEHGDASLRYGSDDGPMYIVEISRTSRATFGEWADQDYGDELAPERTLETLTEAEAMQVWTWLRAGKIEKVRASFSTGTTRQ